ncbi:hypothetical protein BP6252_09281 [Coleophoma cylindrospora]|uniref:Uncharacterized protein n=1 Tax=Coleophoma cylindrospora TaxID=1849047 RepID=A0A3D8R1H7_9HELO|nr:hypothetical protein BP6252_09281 [Coleophoma cylindrospora]
MADPLSATASIIAIIQLSAVVVKYISGVRGATKERKRLREEIRACEFILRQLKDDADDAEEGAAWSETIKALEGADAPLGRLSVALNLVKAKLGHKTGLEKTLTSLKWPFNEKEIETIISAIEREKTLLHLALTNDCRKLIYEIRKYSIENKMQLTELIAAVEKSSGERDSQLSQLMQTFETASTETKQQLIDVKVGIDGLHQAGDDPQRQTILDWLTPIDYITRQQDSIRRRQAGTGQWLLDSKEFQSWLSTDKQTLFCPGIPGAGKTILTFLLAELYFESISTKTTLKKVKDVLKILPTGIKAYDYAYREAMTRITGYDADSEELAKQVLSWITCSRRPLSTSELQCALAVEIGEAELDEENLPQLEDISVCAGLVTIDEKSRIIRLALLTSHSISSKGEVAEIIESSKNVYSRTSFITTPPRNWGHHTRAASTLIFDVVDFLKRKAQVEASSQALLTKEFSSYHECSQACPRQITGFHLAAYFGIRTVIKPLLEQGADINATDTFGSTPLQWASQTRHVEVVQQLLQHGADVKAATSDRQTPLHLASQTGYVEVVQQLLEYSADIKVVDRDGWTPLHWASQRGHIEAVQQLLKYSADIKAVDRNGSTPLHLASQNSHVEVAQQLLDQGADVKAATSDGWTPLYLASQTGHVKVVQQLLEQGADIKVVDRNRRTPLYWASRHEHVEVVQQLLEYGADIKVIDKNRRTPLYWASQYGHVEVVQQLIEHGADIKVVDKNRRTPLHWASQRGHVKVI